MAAEVESMEPAARLERLAQLLAAPAGSGPEPAAPSGPTDLPFGARRAHSQGGLVVREGASQREMQRPALHTAVPIPPAQGEEATPCQPPTPSPAPTPRLDGVKLAHHPRQTVLSSLLFARPRDAPRSRLDLAPADGMRPGSVDVPCVQVVGVPDELLRDKEFARGRIGATPFQPGGLAAPGASGSDESQARKKQPAPRRSAHFMEDRLVENSLRALSVAPEAEQLRLKVPPGFDSHAASLRFAGRDGPDDAEDAEDRPEAADLPYLQAEREWFAQGPKAAAPGSASSPDPGAGTAVQPAAEARASRAAEADERRRRMLAAADSLLVDNSDDLSDAGYYDDAGYGSESELGFNMGLSFGMGVGSGSGLCLDADSEPSSSEDESHDGVGDDMEADIEDIKQQGSEAGGAGGSAGGSAGSSAGRASAVRSEQAAIRDAWSWGSSVAPPAPTGAQAAAKAEDNEPAVTMAEDIETEAQDVDLGALERELDEITAETARVVAQDAFGASKVRAKPLRDEAWAVTKPIDTTYFDQVVPNPAIKHPFELDDFQKQAVMHLESGESVFVAAHTSAGKTVVAEYAVAMAMKHRTRVVYTSPIKALSNQKFRDFSKQFGAEQVGLVTGDVTINGTGSCLVMTTEILRSMLYRGADLIRDIEWVIFDEVHYINDAERGVVWEEVIIMLPAHVNLIFLSATTPNTLEFSSWIGRTKRKRVHVISTDKRPVPLEHFLYAGGKMHKVMDASKRFLRDGHVAALRALKADVADEQKKAKVGTGANPASKKQQAQQKQQVSRPRGFNEKTERAHWLDMVKDLRKKELLPVVVFSFSKRLCDERAAALQSLDLSSKSEKSAVQMVFAKALARLQGSDKKLPQVQRLRELTRRGVGVHHGGLLPILKEVVEILFSRGLVKVLFATETFAIGVNMPARCVVFNSLRKHDGVQFRELLPGEYTQMAGRAGRRGIDSVGTVIISCSQNRDPPSADVLTQMLTGTATKLTSQFRLSYTMILSLLRVAELSVSDMIKRSFSEFGSQRLLGGRDLGATIRKGERRLAALRKELGTPCDSIVRAERALALSRFLLQPLLRTLLSGGMGRKPAAALLVPGRILVVSKGRAACVAACVLAAPKQPNKPFPALLLLRDPATPPSAVVAGAHFHLARLKCTNIVFVTSRTIEPPPGDTSPPASAEDTVAVAAWAEAFWRGVGDDADPAEDVCASAASAAERGEVSNEGLPGPELWREGLDPVKHLKVGEIDFVQQWRECNEAAETLARAPCLGCNNLQGALVRQQKLSLLEIKLREARAAISDESLALFPDFQARLFVLQRVGCISRLDRAVHLKGRVACEINTCDELLLTEMIFNDVFGPLEPEECAAVCSALVMQRKCDDTPVLTPNLEHARDRITAIASELEDVQRLARVEMDPDYMEATLNFGLMEAVYHWARGLPFRDVCALTSLEEGSIVRVITRLDETCREIRNAAQIIGDAELFGKLERASELIKRDIIFAASLYVS